LLEACRERCSNVLGCEGRQLIFTSGGTESNNIAILSFLSREKKGHIITSGIEHASVYQPVQLLKRMGFDVTVIPADSGGIIDPERVLDSVTKDTLLVSLMGVNNETGAVQPVQEIGEMLEKKNGRKIHFHCDAVQCIGKIDPSPFIASADTLAISSHKFSGPRGIGILVSKGTIDSPLSGGGQEGKIRPGTENLQGIYGMTSALEHSTKEQQRYYTHALELEKIILSGIDKLPDGVILPQGRSPGSTDFSPFIINASFPSVPGEVLLRVLDDRGYQVSTGSACSSQKRDNRVLEACGFSEKLVNSSIRISTGPRNSSQEVLSFLSALEESIRILKQ
jgi:cysteine desulfurase